MFVLKKFIPILMWLIGSLIGMTWRVKVIMPQSVNIYDPRSTPSIYSFWHSTLFVVAYLFRNTGKSVIVSPSKDGQRAAKTARRWGHSIIFGSSHKGGTAALRRSVKILREGGSIGITPDGPKGPMEIAKPGAAQISLMSKCPLVTIRVTAESAWRLKSWDKFLLPKPFTKITVTLSEPIYPTIVTDDNDSENTLVTFTKLLEENLAS